MRDEKQPAVYILANGPRGTIYVGVTSALWNRVATHKDKSVKGFTEQHRIESLVWYEHHDDMQSAIMREKQIKKWNRGWKVKMIEQLNPAWIDLHECIDSDRKFEPKQVGFPPARE